MRSVVLLCLLSRAFAGPNKPEISIGIDSDQVIEGNPIGVLQPHIKWDTSGSFEGLDVDGGIELLVKDVGDMPYGIWGRVKKTVRGVGLSAKVDTSSKDVTSFGVDLQAATPSGTTFQLTGVANPEVRSMSLDNIQVTQKFETNAGKFILAPRYNVASSAADVSLVYGRDDTTVKIDANMDKQKFTISQGFGDNNSVSPSFTSDGDIELSYSRTIGSGALTAAYKPDANVKLTYEDGPWVATVTAPIDGLYTPTATPKLSIRKSLDMTMPVDVRTLPV